MTGGALQYQLTRRRWDELTADLGQASVYPLYWSAFLAYFEGNLAETERLASDLIEMSTRQNIATWQPHGRILRGWARCASGDIAEGIAWIEDGIGDYRATGAIAAMSFFLALKAQAFHQANRTCEALEAINEAEALVENLERAYGVPNCIASAACFSRLLVPMRPKLRLRSVRPSESQGNRSRFH
jgi:predicted ATPase